MKQLLTGKTYNPSELYNIIDNDHEYHFVAYIANNINYIAVNAFVHRLHEVNGIDYIEGIVVNLRNDPNEGHSFSEDSFRFPRYSDVKVIYMSEADDVRKELVLIRICRYLKSRLSFRKKQIYILSDRPNPLLLAGLVNRTNRKLVHVITTQGAVYAAMGEWVKCYTKEVALTIFEKIISGSKILYFRPFRTSPGMKREKSIERFYREATEEEQLVLSEIDYNSKYVIYVSQSWAFEQFNDIVESVLEREISKGYTVYIKPHSHERVSHFPQNENFRILPKGYAVESIVGSAPRKPDKIIGVASTSLFTCSAWYGIPCYSILGVVPYNKVSADEREFIRIVKGGEYPGMKLYKY